MTEQTNDLVIPELPELPKVDELTLLKQRADQLGIKYGPNSGVELLRKRIQDKLDGVEEKPEETPTASAAPEKELTEGEKMAKLRHDMYLDQMALVRCRIVCLNPSKADLKGEIFTVQNKILGKVSKYIPFGEETDEGYHIPKILYENLKERRFVQLKVKKGADGREMLPETRWVKEFAIDVLPALTKDELRILANKQAASAGLAV